MLHAATIMTVHLIAHVILDTQEMAVIVKVSSGYFRNLLQVTST
jgi:hypothetical protein